MSGPHATLTESDSDSLGRNMDTREQKVVLMLHSHNPSTSSWCTCLSADISSIRLTLCWETQQMACRRHMATTGLGGGAAILTLMEASVFHLCAYPICTSEGEIDKFSSGLSFCHVVYFLFIYLLVQSSYT